MLSETDLILFKRSEIDLNVPQQPDPKQIILKIHETELFLPQLSETELMLYTSSESETDKILLQPAKTAQILLNLSVTELSLLRFSETELFLPKLPETELILTNELRGCSLKSIVLFLSRRLFSQVYTYPRAPDR